MAISLGTVAAIAGIAGSIGSLIGGDSGKAERAAALYNANVAQMNYKRALELSKDAVKRGEYLAAWRGQQAFQQRGAQRTALAANGVDPNTGSAAQLQGDVSLLNVYDQEQIMFNALQESLGYDHQARQYSMQEEQYRAAAQKSSTGPLGALGNFIGGATKVAKNVVKLYDSITPASASVKPGGSGPQFSGTDIKSQGSF